MNTSIVHLSLKYLKVFRLVVKLSKWIDEELIIINYSDSKLNKVLINRNLRILKKIIHLNEDKTILSKYLVQYYDNYKIVKLLLENGANVHYKFDQVLRWTSHYNQEAQVKLLLKYGADVHALCDSSLRSASCYGYNKVVKLLLEYGADVHAGGDKALKLASENNHEETIKLLKEYSQK